MKKDRGERRGPLARRAGAAVADHMNRTMATVRAGLGAADLAGKILGDDRLHRLSRTARWISGSRLPQSPHNMPVPARFEPGPSAGGAETLLYLPSCVSRSMGPAAGEADCRPLPDVVRALGGYAGLALRSPGTADRLCCGMPWESKGLIDTADAMADQMIAVMEKEGEGAQGILMDTSPCSFRLRRRIAATGRSLAVMDIADFLHDLVLPRVGVARLDRSVMLHITCSSRRMGLGTKLAAVAGAYADVVVIPEDVGCCGFAGDKGFTTPELNAHALRDLTGAVPAGCGVGYSSSRTCEIGLSDHAGIPYRSLAYLVDEAVRKAR